MSCEFRSTFQVSNRSGLYPRPAVDTAGSYVVSQAGGLSLTETIRAVGSTRSCRPRWRAGGTRTRCVTRRRSCWISR
jgi:hypothetical protein